MGKLSLINEIWKDIPTHIGIYQVSNLGNIKRLAYTKIMRNQTKSWEKEMEEKLMTPSSNTGGYLQVTLSNPSRVARIHRLVAEVFLEAPSNELLEECKKAGYDVAFVNHIDEDKLNNNISNLEWCTPSYNSTGNKQTNWSSKISGNNSVHAKLTEDQVKDIFEFLKDKVYSQDEIAQMYNVKQITISNIWTGRSWNSVTGLPVKLRSYKKQVLSKNLSEKNEVNCH